MRNGAAVKNLFFIVAKRLEKLKSFRIFHLFRLFRLFFIRIFVQKKDYGSNNRTDNKGRPENCP